MLRYLIACAMLTGVASHSIQWPHCIKLMRGVPYHSVRRAHHPAALPICGFTLPRCACNFMARCRCTSWKRIGDGSDGQRVEATSSRAQAAGI